MLYRKLHVPVNCFSIFFSIPHSPLSTLLILGKTDVSATVSLISAFITRLSNDCGAYSDLNTTNNNLSNFHFYNDLSQLGLSEGASINNLLEKMPAPSVGVFYCLSKSITGLPFDTQCMVTIFKNGNPFRIEVQDIWSGRTYVAIYSGETVGKFVEYALKSDLQSFLMYKEFTTETRDWTPLTAYRISHTTPTGYRFLAYCHTRTNGWVGSVHPTPININEMSDLWTSVGSGTGTVTLGILFVKAA